MPDPVKQSESTGKKNHPVMWESDEWQRILEAAAVWGAREHLNLGATDVIRAGTRRWVDELIGPAPEAAERAG